MSDLYRMKKAELQSYAMELAEKLRLTNKELVRISTERVDKIRSEIRDEERKEWVETGVLMAQGVVDDVLEDMNERDELPFNLYYELKYRMRRAFDSLDIDSIV